MGSNSLGAVCALTLLFVCTHAVGSALKDDGLNAEENGTNWPAYGRTYAERHASPLHEITSENVQRLGLAWSMELPDVHNGATVPLAVDGVIYFTVDQSLVHAVDAKSGKLLWRFDPQVAAVAGKKLRYTWGPRGIAYWHGKVFVGTTDGRLIAIDAHTGKQVWSQMTVDSDSPRTITGPPRVFNGKVIIGHGGADFAPLRGYVTAYDTESGKQLWRFYVVPGDPTKGFENEAMKIAAATWQGEQWKQGGGGTVWNAITYDPEFNRIYLGTGNGFPWNSGVRSPGGGDNLFLCSIVALDADTGKYVWHYQTTPRESWDYNSAMDITLATLPIDGRERKVILHAPKNGFFYVIDRESGKLISAEKYVKVTWAERIDLATGKPVELPGSRYEKGTSTVWPSNLGGHSWAPQSFNPATRLVYVPTLEVSATFGGEQLVTYPDDPPPASALEAWDPIHQRVAWSVKTPGVWNGGTLTTAGNLVFQGQGDGNFNAYAADSGTALWSFDAKMGISGAPITYSVQGRQYISVIAGWGGSAPGFFGSQVGRYGWDPRRQHHRLLTFVLNGKGQLPVDVVAPTRVELIDDASVIVDNSKAQLGATVYARNCVACHGFDAIAGGYAPDLRASPVPLTADAFAAVVKNGGLVARGMPQFGEFSDTELEALRHYLRARARKDLQSRSAARPEMAK